MTGLKKHKSSNWIETDDAFGDGCRQTGGNRKRARRESSTSILRSASVPDCSPDLPCPAPQPALWIQRHAPARAEQLAVQSRKVEEVQTWLQSHSTHILLLSGPSGSGKTATVLTLAKEMNIEIQEWINPVEQVTFTSKGLFDEDAKFSQNDVIGYTSKTKQFRDWLRGARYSAVTETGAAASKLILMEDLPNHKAEEFHEILQNFTRQRCPIPIVIIISESASAKKTGSIRQIFPPESMERLGIQSIVFNPVTSANMVKALTRIAVVEAQGERRFSVPDKIALESLAESAGGDIRAAINALQFSCLNDNLDLREAFHSTNKVSKAKQVRGKSKSIKASSEFSKIGGKDQSLVMFHALGKVLYAKREEELEPATLPSHLSRHSRRTLISNPDEVIDKTTLSPDAFNCFLHHNFPPFYSKLEDASRVSEYFSTSDLLLREWGPAGKISLSEYGGSLAARAVMFCNTALTPNLGLRRFTKPEHYTAVRVERERSAALQAAFHTLPCRELVTSTAPLLARIRPATLSHTALVSVTEVATLSARPRQYFHSKAIDQHEVFNEDREVSESLVWNTKSDGQAVRDNDQENEDLLIEDFSD